MDATVRVSKLVVARDDYLRDVPTCYDEPLEEVASRVADSGSIGKSDIGTLLFWKRLRADTAWAARLLRLPDSEVRRRTTPVVAAATDPRVSVVDAARTARRLLVDLPGMKKGDALASALLCAAAPARLAIYDSRAQRGLALVELELSDAAGRYSRYLALIEQCRTELAGAGLAWRAREVDLALFQLGRPSSGRTARVPLAQ